MLYDLFMLYYYYYKYNYDEIFIIQYYFIKLLN